VVGEGLGATRGSFFFSLNKRNSLYSVLWNRNFSLRIRILLATSLGFETDILPNKITFQTILKINERIWPWIGIRNPGVTDPDLAKVPVPCGSGSSILTI
jgi:hypothetical protein